MTTRYFIDASGKYLGAFVSGAKPPTAGIEVDSPPEDARQLWTGSEWVAPDQVIHTIIAAARYSREIAGITWSGYGIATDRESQQKMSDERSAVKDGLRVDGKGWKCLDLESGVATFRPTTNAEILEITEAAYRYVSACFDREGELLEAVEDGRYTDSMLSEGWPK